MSNNNRKEILKQFTEGDLLVLFYKLSGHVIPPANARSQWFIERIAMLFDEIDHRLEGRTLPAGLRDIDNLKGFK